MPQIIYTMKNLRKVTPQGKEILKGIWLSFFHGAKIGVLGHNGAGKSTLLRIMAGLDPDFDGEAFVNEGFRVGFLPQEPVLPAGKRVQEVVEEAVADKKAILARYEELAANYSEATADEMRSPPGSHRLDEPLGARPHARDRHGRAALPPADAEVSTLSGGEKRRVALCRLLLQQPDLLLLDEPTNHLDAESVAWLERHLQEYPGTVVAVTHDRYFLDNVAGWILELDRGAGIPWEGQLLRPGSSRSRSGSRSEEKAGLGAPAHARARARVGAHGAARPPGQEQGPPGRLRAAARRGAGARGAARSEPRSTSRPGRGWATSSSRPRA